MNRRTIIRSLPVGAALLGTGCISEPLPVIPTPDPVVGEKPVRGGTLTAVMSRDPVNLDPLRQTDIFAGVVMNTTLDTLYEIDKNARVVGRLVEKTENPQPNVYVMSLRKGIKFHDGTDLDAEAVRFNLQRHIDTAAAPRHQDVRDITSMEVVDATTLRVTLKAAYGPFTSKLTGGAGYIVSPAAVKKLGDALQRDLTGAGSGPFRFVEWRKDTQVVVERNPTYWKKDATGEALPYLEKVVFKTFPNENVRLTNIQTGDADALIGNPPFKDIAGLKPGGELVVDEIPSIGCTLICLNCSVEPFNSPAARRALSYAIDRAQIRKTVFFDNGKVLDTPVPEAIAWAHEKGPFQSRDTAKARQALQAAGKPNGFKFSFQISNSSPELQQTAELIKDQIKEIGLDMEIQLIEFATILANGQAGSHQALGLGSSGDIDPDTIYSLYATGAGMNLAKYSNPQLDRLLNEGRTTLEQGKRADVYKQAQKLIFEEQPYIVYFNAPQIATVRKVVQNYPNTYNGYWGTRDYERVWKTGAR